MQAAIGCCILFLYLCPMQDGLDTVQLALVVFSCHQLAQILYLHSWSSSTATCANGVFLGALAHLLMCTQTNMHKLQLALCGGGGINTNLVCTAIIWCTVFAFEAIQYWLMTSEATLVHVVYRIQLAVM